MSVAGVLPFETASPIVAAVQALYGMVKRVDEYIDGLITDMKQSTSVAVARTGRVLEGAKFGFGLGYLVPVAIIAAGQLLLGNTLGAAATVGSAMVLANPVASTCAAIGAVYYGWQALTEQERSELLERLAEGLKVGAELIRSVLNFVVVRMKELLTAENFAEVKQAISAAAEAFGKTLADVTGSFKDRVAGAYDAVSESLESVAERLKSPRRAEAAKLSADAGKTE